MKRKLLLTLIALCCIVVQSWAYDFSAVNSDGKTIYYKKTSTSYPKTVEVTSGGSGYSGIINIPPSVVDTYGTSYTVTAIGQSAFWNCSNLQSVSIPNTVTEIKERAFQHCYNLESVSIPNTVTAIGDFTFYNCEKLASIDLPSSLIYVNEYVLYGCKSLTSISIPNSVVSIQERAFEYCSGLKSVIISNSVNSIGLTAFWGCTAIELFVVEDGNPAYDSRENCNAIIMTNYNYLCYGCKNTVIPNSVTSIACYSFYNCTNLTSITIPNSVTTIEDNAFSGCTGLTSMTCLAQYPPIVGDSGFSGVPTSMDLYVPSSSLSRYQSTLPWNTFNVHGITPEYNITVSAMPSTSGTVTGGGTYSEGATVTLTATSSYFNGWSENGVIVSTDATYSFTATKNRNLIAQYRGEYFDFASNNTYGKTIFYKINTNVETYQVGVANANYNGDVVIPSAVKYNGYVYTVTSINDGAFNKCKNLTSVSIPNTVTRIGNGAFKKCHWTSFEMSNSIVSIGNNAFEESSLNNITLPNTLTTIGNYAFSYCYLTSIQIPSSVTMLGECVFNGCSNLSEVILPNTLTYIPAGLFWGCTSIHSIDIPDAVTSIGDNAFLYCTNLSEADISWNLNTIGSNAFSGCNNLTSLTIQGSVTSIGENAFSGCYGLESINVANSNTVYDSRNNCNAIIEKNTNKLILGCKNTTIPNSVTSIGNAAFYGCYQLSNVTIPNSVTNIGSSAFYGCSSLTNIAIPNSVTNIGSSAFCGCSQLSNVTLPNSLTSIENSLFYECSNIVNITIPNSVTSIGASAFQYCGLTSVEIPNSVQTIGSSAFRCCPLAEINIPSGLTSIEYRAFSYCSFTNVNIPNSVTTIGEEAFEYCTNLQSVKIPNSVTVVFNKAFDHCTSLAEVTCYAITPPPAGKNTFRGALASMIIKVPTSSIEVYQALTPWNNYTINGINEYRTVTISSSPSNYGSVSGGGSFLYGSNKTVTATPYTGYAFLNWTENNEVVSTNAEYNFALVENRNLVANFGIATYSISVSANNSNYGTVTSGGTYNYGSTATLIATPNSGFTFVNWTENNNVVSTNPTYSFTVNGDRNLVANFIVTPDYLTLTATENNTLIGLSVKGSPNISTLEYSFDGINWISITGTITFRQLQKDEYVKFRSKTQISNSSSNYIRFNGSRGGFKISGDINTLINYIDTSTVILEEYSFYRLFSGCLVTDISNLRLPANSLAYRCYYGLFNGCTELELIPSNLLPATILAENCYESMFYGCNKLINIPSGLLPATSLAYGCYMSMFGGCTSLSYIPTDLLPATSLLPWCYEGMFIDCSGLTSVPSDLLPATTITDYCYCAMFAGCTSLTTSPELPASTLADNCYYEMFKYCSSLNSVTTHVTTWNPEYATNWLSGVSATGNFYNLGGADIPTGTSGIPEGWTEHGPRVKTITAVPNDENYGTVSGAGSYLINETCTLTATPNTGYTFINWTENDVEVSTDAEFSFTVEADRNLVANFSETVTDDVFHFTALTDDVTIGMQAEGSAPNVSLQYCTSINPMWYDFIVGTTQVIIDNGQKLYIKAKNENDQLANSISNYNRFAVSNSASISGNIMYLLDPTGEMNDFTPSNEYAFCCLFKSCNDITDASQLELPANTLARWCYESMFFSCTGLTIAPELPAITLAYGCYYAMFHNCTGLTAAPLLPATTMATDCYSFMFDGCTGLTVAPELPATTMAGCCYQGMFMDCTGLTSIPELPATTLATECYSNMFNGCTGLTVVELPATTLANQCYYHMFFDCHSLNTISTYAADWNTLFSITWLYGVAATGDFYNLGGADIPTGESGIPTGWTEHGPRVKTITAVPNDENFGTVSGYGSYFVNETCTLTAIPNTGYTFINWTENDEVVSTDAEYDFTVETDRSLVANFIITPNYFTLTATENNTVIGIMINGVPDISTLEYSYNSLDWNKVTETTTFNTLQTNEFVKFRSRNQVTKPSNDFIGFTGSTGSFKASGDIMTLIDFTDVDNAVMSYHSFGNLFYNCNNLIDISNLVLAETLDDGAWYCYSCMFYGCTGLTSIPSGLLPATTLTHGCYSCMFKNCTGLTNIPINTLLPATSLAVGCYENMFEGCTGISNIPWLPSTTLVERCYESMFKDCTGISSIPALPATTLANGCYKRMFSGCSGLNSIDWLTVPTLVDNCFCEMFKGCSSLNSVAINVASWNSEFAHDWLANVSETGEFYNRYGADIPTGASGIPEGWTEYGPRVKTITAIPNDENFGTVSGAGSFIINETCTLTATPNEHYTFINWTENDIEVSTDAEYSFTVENDRNLVANFIIQTFEITASTNNSDYGTVTGGGTFDYGTMATLTATPNSGYTFVNWTENNIEVSTDAEYSFTVENDRNLVANFAIQTFEITASANNSDFGTVTGGGTFDFGTTATLTATPNTGYTFVNWTENNIEVSTDAEYSFTVENERNLVANFQSSGSGTHWNPDISLYSDNMSVVAEIHIDGVVQTSTDIEIGAFCDDEVRGSRRVEYKGIPFNKYVAFLTIYGESNDNITFKVYDHQNNEELNCRISQSLTFTPNGTVGDLINPYVIEFFTTANITATANPAVGGTVSGDGVYSVGEMVTLTATADGYYRFVNWTENNVEVSTSETYSFTAFDDRSLVANFEIRNHWIPDESLYADNMSVVGEIQIDGVTQTSGDIEIGAFCGEEVRGSQRIVYTTAPIDKYLVFLTVYGESNDNITFKLYNHQNESEYDLTAPEPITFTPNATVGGLITPHILNFCHTQSRELTAGWNWYSTFIDIEGEDGFNMLTAGLGEDGLQVKSQSQFALYYSDYNIWTGSLNEADNHKLYMIQMSSPHTLVMTGAFTDVQSTPITINKGWTWIGYPVTESMSLDEATSNINPTNGDYFKSQSGFSIYYEGYGWAGSLNTLEPGHGYMYQNNGESSMSLVYPIPSAKGNLKENTTADGNHWVPNAYQYADNMSVVAVININGVEQMSENLEIGAFSDGECRGSARPIYVEAVGRYMLFMTVYGEGSENLDFRLFDADNNEEYQLQTGLDFEPNGTVGNLVNPYVFDLTVMGIGEEQPFAFSFYPNPISSGKQLAIEGEYDKIEIINSIGVVIGEYTNTNEIEITMIPGVYYIRAINDKSIIINKLVVKQ